MALALLVGFVLSSPVSTSSTSQVVSPWLVSFAQSDYIETDGGEAQDPLMPDISGAASPQSQAAANGSVATSIAVQDEQATAQNICASYGATFDHVFAPGFNVRAGGFTLSNGQYQVQYGHWNGTSYAAPFVTGAVAAYLQKHPKASVSTVSNWIKNSAKPRMQGSLQSSPNKFRYLAPGGY